MCFALGKAIWDCDGCLVLSDLGAGSTTISYCLYEILSGAYYPQIDFGCSLGSQQVEVKGHLTGLNQEENSFWEQRKKLSYLTL